MRPGQGFESSDVVAFYKFRPDYPDRLFQRLTELAPARNQLLDLGCGPGKIALGACGAFERVTAVDPSAEMIAEGKSLQSDHQQNIQWLNSLAEVANLGSCSFDLIVAAASIHWMDHGLLFPRLLQHVRDDHVFAVVNGDEAYQPPWEAEWHEFLSKWVFELTGKLYEYNRESSDFTKKMTRHRQWLDLARQEAFEQTVKQSVDDFIRCQFSRDTFSITRLQDRTNKFTEELRGLLLPYSDSSGRLTFTVRTNLEWGRIRPSPVSN